MPFLVVFKRFEVWLLLAVVAALVAFAIRPEAKQPGGGAAPVSRSDPGPSLVETPPIPEPERAAVSLREVRVESSSDGLIVETVLEGRSPTGGDLVLDEANVSATTGAGEPVSLFFEPFREPVALSAEEDSLATLRWWLARPAESLAVRVGGETIPVELP